MCELQPLRRRRVAAVAASSAVASAAAARAVQAIAPDLLGRRRRRRRRRARADAVEPRRQHGAAARAEPARRAAARGAVRPSERAHLCTSVAAAARRSPRRPHKKSCASGSPACAADQSQARRRRIQPPPPPARRRALRRRRVELRHQRRAGRSAFATARKSCGNVPAAAAPAASAQSHCRVEMLIAPSSAQPALAGARPQGRRAQLAGAPRRRQREHVARHVEADDGVTGGHVAAQARAAAEVGEDAPSGGQIQQLHRARRELALRPLVGRGVPLASAAA